MGDLGAGEMAVGGVVKLPAKVERLKGLLEKAPLGPFSWMFAGDKCDSSEFIIGVVWDEKDRPLSGYVDGLQENWIPVEYLLDGQKDARPPFSDLVVDLLNLAPDLIELVEAALARIQELEEGVGPVPGEDGPLNAAWKLERSLAKLEDE